MMLQNIQQKYPYEDFLLIKGADEAIIGVSDGRIIYSKTSLVRLEMKKGVSLKEAIVVVEEIYSSFIGKNSPIVCDDLFN